MKVVVYTKSGAKKDAEIQLDKTVFGLIPNHELLGLAYRAYLANGRGNNAMTLTRGLIRGGGKKPWRQKGTGRARVGSSRVPNWRGGGVVFGPTGQENYTVNLPLKMKRQAIRHALSAQAADGKIIVLETFSCPEGKVKPTLDLLSKLKAEGNVLIAVSLKDQLVDRATRNIAGVKAVAATYLNVFDILNADSIIISEKALEAISQWLGQVKPEPAQEPAKAETKAKAEVAK